VKWFAQCHGTVAACNVGVLWPNGWMDQDETWHGGGPRPWPHRVRWGPSSPSPKGYSPQFLAYVSCGQTAGWIKMPLGSEVGFSPDDIVLDRDPPPPPQKGGTAAPTFRPMSVVAKRLDEHLFVGLIMAALCNRGGPLYFCPVISFYLSIFFFYLFFLA